MRFYIGSSLSNREAVSWYAQRLKERGWEHTYDWAKLDPEAETPERLGEIAQRERRGVEEADAAVFLLPGGRGTHIELGMALALGKRVFLCGAAEAFAMESAVGFYQLPEIVRLTGSAEENVREILAAGEADRRSGGSGAKARGVEIVPAEASAPQALRLFSEHDDFMLDAMGGDRRFYTRYSEKEKLEAVWIAYADGLPAGCAAYRKKEAGTGEVKRLFVRPEYRGGGIAKELLKNLERHAGEQGCAALHLDTRLNLEPAVSLYRSFGYQTVYQEGLYIQMEKRLEGRGAGKHILLTSAGFENPVVRDCFLEMLGKPPAKARALFIPTAAIDEDAKAVLPKCRNDLLGAGILPGHITDFDLDREMSAEELSGYDTVYFCGGSTEYLLERIKAVGFDRSLDAALERGLVYVGVSAGSVMAAENLPGSLGYLPRELEVHCESGSPRGKLPEGTVYLTNAQAIKILDGDAEIIE